GFTELYRNNVGSADRTRAGLQSALHGAVSRTPGPCGSSRTSDRGDSQVDLSADQPSTPGVFYVDGHRKAVYSDVLVPRGPVGKLGGKILGCRELVVLHDADGHPLLATTHRGDYHLTIGLPQMLHCYEQATGVALIRDWRRLLVVEQTDEAADDQDWQADLAPQQQRFWEEGWQALPAPPALTMPKLIPVITTGHGLDAVELAQTYFQRWKCQEN